MADMKKDFGHCDKIVSDFEKVIDKPRKTKSKKYYTGVDLGTACVVVAVLDEDFQPVAGAYRYADVVKDGMVVDYIGAVDIVKELKKDVEEKLGEELLYASSAIPPGTDELDSGAIKNVVMGAGFELVSVLDEPTAANEILKIENGAVVDIGGGTTGISILENGKVVYVADEPTGGTHFSLVVAGAYGKSYSEAELYKRDEKNHGEVINVVKPVIEKIGTIISEHVEGRNVEQIYLVGGTACLTGLENIVEASTGIPTYKPKNPMFVTPLGIAVSCGER